MKSLLTIFTLIFFVTFSSTSFAEWTKVGEHVNGDTQYLDFERVRKVDGYIYFWWLSDLMKPDKDGDLSYVSYRQGDCKLMRLKGLSVSYYKEPMGRGSGQRISSKNSEWSYPPPNSTTETVLESVCSR